MASDVDRQISQWYQGDPSAAFLELPSPHPPRIPHNSSVFTYLYINLCYLAYVLLTQLRSYLWWEIKELEYELNWRKTAILQTETKEILLILIASEWTVFTKAFYYTEMDLKNSLYGKVFNFHILLSTLEQWWVCVR